MRKITFYNGGIFHILNRGVDKRRIFLSDDDRQLFYQYMYLFSDSRYENREGCTELNMLRIAANQVIEVERDPLVKFFCFSLRPNHFHFFIQQVKDNGVSLFLHKLQKTYSREFNKSNGRSGTLFEGSFKVKHVESEAHFMHLPRYIHLNSLDNQMPEWREGKIKDWDRAQKILNNDPWSSHQIYSGKKSRLPIIEEEFIKSTFSSKDQYFNYLKEWATSRIVDKTERDFWDYTLEGW